MGKWPIASWTTAASCRDCRLLRDRCSWTLRLDTGCIFPWIGQGENGTLDWINLNDSAPFATVRPRRVGAPPTGSCAACAAAGYGRCTASNSSADTAAARV